MVRPILFNGEMVRAILEGRKTVTRRVIKGADESMYAGMCGLGPGLFDRNTGLRVKEPYYRLGDILYVRETWDFNPHHHAGGDSKSTQLFILISVNFHINLLLQPLTTSKPSKSIPKTPTIPDSPGANLPGVSWVLPIRTGVSEN